jgi:hypothetical protein
MNLDKEVHGLAVSSTVANAQLLERIQAPPAAKVHERHADPFEIVTERDVKRLQKRLQQAMEDERLHALARRSLREIIKSRRRARRKVNSTKQEHGHQGRRLAPPLIPF